MTLHSWGWEADGQSCFILNDTRNGDSGPSAQAFETKPNLMTCPLDSKITERKTWGGQLFMNLGIQVK